MARIVRSPWAVLPLLLGSGLAAAERPLTLQEALGLARESNHDLAAARARIDQARAGVEQAWVALLPTLAAQGRYTHNYKGAEIPFSSFNRGVLGLVGTLEAANAAAPPSAHNPALDPALSAYAQELNRASAIQGLPPVVTIQKQEQLDSSLSATVPLLNPAGYAALSAARKSFEASGAGFAVTETSVLYTVAQSFYAAAGTDELLLARKDAVSVARKTVQDSKAKLLAGTGKRTDVNQAELSLLQAQQALLEAQDSRAQAYRALATLVQLPGDYQVVAADPADAPAASPEALLRSAMERRPELRQDQRSADSYRAQATAAELRWAPTLSAFGRATLANYAGFTGDYYSWAAGVQLDWVLFDGDSRSAQAHLASAQAAEQEARIAAQRDGIRDEVRNALDGLSTARSGLVTSQSSVGLARETLSLVRAQYDAGIATQLDVLHAQDVLVASEVQLAQARFNLALAGVALERAAGIFPERAP